MYSTSVGVLYGYAKHARAKATKDLSDELLDSLPSLPSVLFWPAKATEPLLETSIASRFAIWRSHGFQEIQELANHRWQQEIQPKCRKKSTKDHAWISPELADKLIGACTDDTFFGDHALLYATFSDLGRPEPIPIWIKPKPIQWEQVPQEAIDACEVNADTMTYQQVFSAVEDAAHHALCSAGEHSPIPLQRGRGSVVLPTLARAPITPLHQSRSHDFQIDYQGENYQHTKWCRQPNFRALVSCGHDTPTNRSHQQKLWHAIRAAPGFPKGFPTSWAARKQRLPGEPPTLPCSPPNAVVANTIYLGFLAGFRRLRRHCCAIGVAPLPPGGSRIPTCFMQM